MFPLDHLSQSSLSTFLNCPRQFRYKYIDGVPYKVTESLWLGINFHKALEYYYESKINNNVVADGDVIKYFEECWRGAHDDRVVKSSSQSGGLGFDADSEQSEELMANGIGMLSAYLNKFASTTTPLLVEQDFRVKEVYGVKLVGRIDMIDNNGTIIDFKTATRMPTAAKVSEGIQPIFYAMCAGGPTNFEYQYTTRDLRTASFKFAVSANSIAFLRDEIIPSVVDAIAAGAFVPNNSSYLCDPRWCDYWSDCVGKDRS